MTRADKLFVWIVGISTIALFVSNILAAKLTVFAGIAVDCGIILYPISYVVGDLSIEFFGRKRADCVVAVSTALTGLAVIFIGIAIWLPAYPGWEGQAAFAAALGFVPRIVIGSIIAYLFSGFTNNFVFERVRRQHPDSLLARFIGSSLLAHFVDSAIFETIAFLGVLSFREFLAQAAFAYVAGLAIEAVLFLLVTRPVHRLIAAYLHSPD